MIDLNNPLAHLAEIYTGSLYRDMVGAGIPRVTRDSIDFRAFDGIIVNIINEVDDKYFEHG